MDEVEEVFDPEGILTYLAGNVALASWDSYAITGHNYYLYEAEPGRFTMLPWDMNGSLEPFDTTICSPWQGLLSAHLLDDPDNEERYFDLVRDILETSASNAALLARLETAQELVGSEFPQELFDALSDHIQQRSDLVEAQLDDPPDCGPPE